MMEMMTLSTVWLSGQLLDFVVEKKLFNEFYRTFKNNSADKDDFQALECTLITIKDMYHKKEAVK